MNPHPLVWHMAAGYQVPGGIEAHVLHYASEMRNQGFDTRVVVFKPLPRERHRFLAALEQRGIPILSLDDLSARRARWKAAGLLLPWRLYTAFVKGRRPNAAHFRIWVQHRESGRALSALLAKEAPDLIHIFGRLRTDAWARFPAERTIFHEMMTGTVDRHWTQNELAQFRGFAARAARYFAPGNGVAENVRREFGIQRPIDAVFTMCPDEAGREESGVRSQESGEAAQRHASGVATDLARGWPAASSAEQSAIGNRQSPMAARRFGVICRLTGQKGIPFLLEALKLYRERHGQVHFTFGGFGPMQEEIERFARTHDLPHVRIVPVGRPADILATLDVFVHPSVDDAMPMAIAEALMCGVPCIVCRVGGCADLVCDGVEGFVIEPRRPEQILERMERFAGMSADERDAFRRRARARYEEVCRPEKVGREVAGHYRAILEKAGSCIAM